jgi:hypothetical protein
MLKIDKEKKEILYEIPLTTTSGKIRVKERNFNYEYGRPVATRTTKFSQKHYIEWQIGYDVVTKEIGDKKRTSLEKEQFIGANGKTKSLFELSEILYYFVLWKIISKKEIEEIKDFLESLDDDKLIDTNPDFAITRSHPVNKRLFEINFEKSTVSYPLLIHKFKNFDIITEIIIREKQRAIGIQPMLYLCFPITELQPKTSLLGREANSKETANFVLNKNNSDIILEMLKIFGILSASHKHDVIQIINIILNKE